MYLATLHPAFILRSAGYISQFLTDMRSIKLTPSIDWRKIGYTVVNDDTRYAFITELGNWYYDKRMVAFDVETHNLDPKSPLLELGVTAYDDEAWIVPGKLLREDESIREIIDHFMQGATLVAHNGKFDQQVLARNGIAQFNLTDDTMLMHYCLDEQKGTHDLKQVASSFLGVHDYESELVDTYFKNMKRTERDYSLNPTG
jgi:DNA polymerase I-like protein with 3'-5' exonuclease and polymerase domains